MTVFLEINFLLIGILLSASIHFCFNHYFLNYKNNTCSQFLKETQGYRVKSKKVTLPYASFTCSPYSSWSCVSSFQKFPMHLHTYFPFKMFPMNGMTLYIMSFKLLVSFLSSFSPLLSFIS